MRLVEWIKRGLAAIGLATLASCTTPPAPAPLDSVRPALWRVSDPDTSIYLFGTFHLLPQDYRWETPALRQAMANSSELVLETLLDDKNPRGLAAEMARIGFAANLPPLASRVSPAARSQLAAAIKASGLPPAYFDRMKTWTAAFTLISLQFKSLGLKGEAGVEPNLRRSFEAAGKRVGELESNSEQLAFFDTLSEPAQRSFLEGAVSEPDKVRGEFAAMLKSWATGDIAGIARSFNAELTDAPELRAALLTRRNRNWSRWIERRLARPGTLMVAVGAGHLAGEESVIAMLERDGYKVQRLE